MRGPLLNESARSVTLGVCGLSPIEDNPVPKYATGNRYGALAESAITRLFTANCAQLRSIGHVACAGCTAWMEVQLPRRGAMLALDDVFGGGERLEWVDTGGGEWRRPCIVRCWHLIARLAEAALSENLQSAPMQLFGAIALQARPLPAFP